MFAKKKIRSKTAMDYALRVLTRKDYFESELYDKISEHFGEEDAAETLKKLKEYGYADDARCRESLIAARLRAGYGIFRIQAEIREKTGQDDSLEDMDDIAIRNGIDRKAILTDAVKRFIEVSRYEDAYEMKQKCIARFYRKGHPYGDIEKIIRQELNI